MKQMTQSPIEEKIEDVMIHGNAFEVNGGWSYVLTITQGERREASYPRVPPYGKLFVYKTQDLAITAMESFIEYAQSALRERDAKNEVMNLMTEENEEDEIDETI